MSFNIMDLVSEQLSDQVSGQIGNLLGDQSSMAANGLETAVPALLNGFTKRAAAPGGADVLFDAVSQQDDGLLDNLGSMLGGDSNSLIHMGSKMLGGLFGSAGLGSLTSVIGAVTGLSKGNSGSLLGIVAPIIIGVIKRKVLSGGLNASGLLDMLNSQQDNINAAMPMGLTDQLNSSGFLSSISSAASGAASSIGDAAQTAVQDAGQGLRSAANDAASSAANAAGDAVAEGSSMFRKLLPVIGLVVLGWLGWNFLGNSGKDEVEDVASATSDAATAASDAATTASTEAASAVTEAATTASTEVTSAAGEAATAVADAASSAAETATNAANTVVTATNDAASSAVSAASEALDVDLEGLTSGFNGIFDSAKTSLEGITDTDTATAAVPKLQEMGDTLGGLMENIPEAARGPISGVVSSGLETIQPLLENARGLPGVGAIIDPVITPIMEKLSSLAG